MTTTSVRNVTFLNASPPFDSTAFPHGDFH
jgi:hypothetical protein